MERGVEACEHGRLAGAGVRHEMAEPHRRGRLGREREQRKGVLPEDVGVVRPADLEPVLLAELHQLDEPCVRGVGQNGDAEAESHLAGLSAVQAGDASDRCVGEPVECGDGELQMLLPGVLELRVGQPAQALHEQHHCRDAGAGDLGCIVQGA